MKKLLAIIIFSLTFSINAQSFEDAWRYQNDNLTGTARFTGMSGAFSSIGGDLSAVSLNPAGATTFTTNRLTGTFSLFYNSANESNYFDQHSQANYTSIDDRFVGLDQIGAMWVFKSDVNDWNKIAVGINYNKDVEYGDIFKINGINQSGNSATTYFVDNANGVPLNDLKLVDDYASDYEWLGENYDYGAQQGYLAYQSYVINAVDPSDDNNTQYVANATYDKVKHFNKITGYGSKSHADFTIAGTYQNKLQLGFGLSFIGIDYVERNTIEESNYLASSDLQFLKLRNTLRVEGNGIGVKMGAIYKVLPGFKLSLAYHSPQWIEIDEYMKQSIHTEMKNGDVFDIKPGIENVFAPYKIITPSKIIAGGSAVIKKSVVLSVDYTYQNMKQMHFKEIDPDADTTYFDNLNDDIDNTMQATHKINVGAEVRIKKLYLRGGGFMSTSPVKNNTELYAYKGYSAGAGYNFGSFSLDFAYLHRSGQITKNVLTLPDNASVNSTFNKYLLGVRYNF